MRLCERSRRRRHWGKRLFRRRPAMELGDYLLTACFAETDLEDIEYLVRLPRHWFMPYCPDRLQDENLAGRAGSVIRQKLLHVLRGWLLGR